MGLKCPQCGSRKTFACRYRILQIHVPESVDLIRRSRRCSVCGKLFKTIEMEESEEVTRLPKVGFKIPIKPETKRKDSENETQ